MLTLKGVLSPFGETHPASAVLLRPDDAAKFDNVSRPGAFVKPGVIARPDGSLLLLVTFGPPSYPDAACIVGAVEPSAWAWADPKKRGVEITCNIVAADPEKMIAAWNAAAERMNASGRTSILPTRTPKDGDRLDSFTVAELDGLPVGARFELPGYEPIERREGGWLKNGSFPYTISVGDHDLGHRLLVLPKPAEAPKPAPSPKVGDRWGDLDADQRQTLPVGTVIKEEGCITVAVWTRLPSGWSGAVVDTVSSTLFRSETGEPTKTSRIVSIPAVSK